MSQAPAWHLATLFGHGLPPWIKMQILFYFTNTYDVSIWRASTWISIMLVFTLSFKLPVKFGVRVLGRIPTVWSMRSGCSLERTPIRVVLKERWSFMRGKTCMIRKDRTSKMRQYVRLDKTSPVDINRIHCKMNQTRHPPAITGTIILAPDRFISHFVQRLQR